MKTCSICKETKEYSEFYTRKDSKDDIRILEQAIRYLKETK